MDSSLHSIIAAQLIQDRMAEATGMRQARSAAPARQRIRRPRVILRRLRRQVPASTEPRIVQ